MSSARTTKRASDQPVNGATARRRSARAGWLDYLKSLGPGLVTGASDDDPSGIATYAQAGAQFQYGLLWTSLVTLPLMATVQETCDRTALSTGKSLGALAAERFGRWRVGIGLLLGLLVVANVLNIAADIAAVGEGANLLHAGPAALWAIIAGVVVTCFVVVGSFTVIARFFKILCLALFGYVVVVFAANPSWSAVLTHTLIPHVQFNNDYMLLLVAVLGTTISPYLFFWQSAHRIEELRAEPEGRSRPVALKSRSRSNPQRKLSTSRLDDFSGMAYSNLIMFSIVVATGATIGTRHGATISTAAQAAQALRPAAGGLAATLFALGFIGSGMLAIPVLAGSGAAALSGLDDRSWGFSRSARDAPFFYALVVAGTIGGTLFTFVGANPVKLLVYAALINGLLAAPFLAVIMVIAQDASIMGRKYRNGHAATILGWSTVALMTAAACCYLTLTYG